ncbi:hypothetical protein LX59_01250 [Azomonas agilis]|uniref:Uncharacterized protein n=1 Tax=Azomonas agilis TaxID=116849 RepID=A0A562IZE4_9GAMM|nr:hypothetical protein [Azomonas agilis]TWH76327.1 hypothetical protein LX59_01250 [Azomonas agilis]
MPSAHQKGFATLLAILFIGLGIIVTSLGMMQSIRSHQERQIGLQAVTQAQLRAWNSVEIIRRYLSTQSCANLPTLLSNTQPLYENKNVSKASVTHVDTKLCQVAVRITGYAATDSKAQTTSTINAVYELTTTSTSSPYKPLTTGLVFNENLTYSGGSFQVINGENMANFSITGSLSISRGTTAKASGCIKKDISLSGGGVADNAVLLSERDITISSMSQPKNLSVSGRNIYISQSGGSYNYIKSGAFKANIKSGTTTIGTAIIGGKLNTSNYVIPHSTGNALVTLNDSESTTYYLDLSKVTTDANGNIQKNDSATLISGSDSLPDTFSLSYDSIYGGVLNFLTGTVHTLWGNTLTLDGWSGTYTYLYAHNTAKMNSATIGTLNGGADIYVRANGNLPTIQNPSKISGIVRNTDNSNQVYSGAINNLTRQVSNASPGLPGIPLCNITLIPVDAASYKESANYVFYFDSATNAPMLKIQNVKQNSNNMDISKTYNLKTDDIRTINGLDFMQCGWYNNHCLRNSTPSTGWNLNGIYKLPPGVLFFEGPITVDGVDGSKTLYNSIISTQKITLTSSGHGPLVAPNFATPQTICNATFYPSNLCDKSVTPPVFATWSDSNGTYSGIPIANVAIMTDTDLSVSGWTISGSVILGGSIATNGALVTIYGGLSVGGNKASSASINNGGILIDVSKLTKDQTYIPSTDEDNTGSNNSIPAEAKIKWTQYY